MTYRLKNSMGEYLLLDPEEIQTSHGPAYRGPYVYLPPCGPAEGEPQDGLFYLDQAEVEPV